MSTLKKMGRDISLQEIDEIMKKHDKSNDGVIQFQEFKEMLLDGEEPTTKEDMASLMRKPTVIVKKRD